MGKLADATERMRKRLKELEDRTYTEKSVLVSRGHGIFSVETVKIPKGISLDKVR